MKLINFIKFFAKLIIFIFITTVIIYYKIIIILVFFCLLDVLHLEYKNKTNNFYYKEYPIMSVSKFPNSFISVYELIIVNFKISINKVYIDLIYQKKYNFKFKFLEFFTLFFFIIFLFITGSSYIIYMLIFSFFKTNLFSENVQDDFLSKFEYYYFINKHTGISLCNTFLIVCKNGNITYKIIMF